MGIIEFSPEVTQAVLERCITKKDIEGSKKYEVSDSCRFVNFIYLFFFVDNIQF
jgi:hypothetical protein